MRVYPSGQQPGTTPDLLSPEPAVSGVTLTPLAQQHLDQTRPWVRFMSIMCFLGAGLMVVMGLFVMLAMGLAGFGAGEAGAPGAAFGAIGGTLLGVVYIASGLLYVFPGLYLHRYAGAIGLLQAGGGAGSLEDAIGHQKSFWRFVGILTAIGTALAILGVLLAVLVPLLFAVSRGR